MDLKKKIESKKRIRESDSESSSEGFEASGSSSGDEDFLSSKVLCKDDFAEFDHTELKIDDYVLVRFQSEKNNQVYYVGKIIQDKTTAGSFEVTFMRKSSKIRNAFIFPAVPDVSVVDENDIKMKLIPEEHRGSTKRQQSYLSFGIDFGVSVR